MFVYACACVHVCACVWERVRACACAHVRAYARACVVCVCTRVVWVCVYARMVCVRLCVRVRVVRARVCACVCVSLSLSCKFSIKGLHWNCTYCLVAVYSCYVISINFYSFHFDLPIHPCPHMHSILCSSSLFNHLLSNFYLTYWLSSIGWLHVQ